METGAAAGESTQPNPNLNPSWREPNLWPSSFEAAAVALTTARATHKNAQNAVIKLKFSNQFQQKLEEDALEEDVCQELCCFDGAKKVQ